MKALLSDLIKDLDVVIKGNPNCLITGISPIQHAKAGDITFLANSQYRKYLPITQAEAVILSEADAPSCSVNAVITSNPYYIYAKIAERLFPHSAKPPSIDATVVLGADTQVHPTARIDAYAVLGERVSIGKQVVIGAGCVIGDDVQIGNGSILDANVTLYSQVKIGQRCHFASGVVIGSEGFGFANKQGVWYKVPQLGGVTIGDDVDVGANTAIDRGAVEDTVIEDGVKLDNLIQVGHNVRVGAHTVIAGCVAIAGSATIGKYCMIGGSAGIAGHITLTDRVMITGMTTVTKSITEPGVYSSGIAGVVPNQEFRKNNARFHRLEQLMNRVKQLENTIKEITERKST